MAFLIKTDGTITEVKPKDGVGFSLEELQAFVGGYIEHVPRHRLFDGVKNGEQLVTLGKNDSMYINEEGKLNDLPINVLASALYKFSDSDPIVGDVLVFTTAYRKNSDGESEDYCF